MLRQDVARHFGVRMESIFTDYMEVIRALRNICAHGNVLYSYRPHQLRRGPASGGQLPAQNLHGALGVVTHFLGVISERLCGEFRDGLRRLIEEFAVTPGTRHVLGRISGFRIP